MEFFKTGWNFFIWNEGLMVLAYLSIDYGYNKEFNSIMS